MLTYRVFRYGLAPAGVAAAMGLRLSLDYWVGPGLPPYITFYPMVMLVAILGGLGPGIFATAISGLTVAFWIISPVGHFYLGSPIDQIGMLIFIIMGFFISVFAEIYRRNRSKAAVYDREMVLSSKQEALRESEERFRVMINAMPQLGWIASPDGYIIWYNERWYEYTGTSPEQMEGWGWQVVHDPAELPKVLDRWKTSIASGNTFEMIFPLRGTDGKFRQFLTRAYPLKNATGRVVQWFGTNTDVEEQSRKEIELQESEARYRSLVEQASDGIFLADSQGHYIDVNSEGCNMLGYSREEILKLSIADVITPEEIPRISSEVARFADGEVVVSVWQFLRKDGTRFFGEIRGRQLTNGNLQAILIDITERKKAEKLIEESEKRHRTLFENMLDGYANCTMLYEHGIPFDFIFDNVNSKFEQLTKLKNIVGSKIGEVLPGLRLSNPEIFVICGRIALSGQPEKFETYVESLTTWFAISVYSTEQEHFVAIFQDVTERKRSEQELIVLNNQLTQEVGKRTSDLADLTAHVQEIAESERAELARELHDEMGSILTGLSMEVGRLIKKASDVEFLQDLTIIKQLITDASQAKRNIVDQLYPTILDDYGYIPAAKYLIKYFQKHSGIKVEWIEPKENIDMEPPIALAAYRITQECLTNIAKHSQASMVQINIAAKDDLFDLTIHDNGKGMPSKTSSRSHGIFGMIERARNLGGSLEIGSDEGQGTTAHLILPLALAKPNNRKKVLLVDDHAIVREALRQLLDREAGDFSVEGEAADGKTAIQMAVESDWDIVLLDITLPKMNGIKVLEQIKAVKPNLPIIMLSSHSVEEYGELALSKGAACYLQKGETEKLVEAMRRATSH